jgi:tRNA(fMet)-specific endonuclease VapC
MKFLLDTEHISILQSLSQPAFGLLEHRMNQHPGTNFFYCTASLHEQVIGAHSWINRATKPAGVIRGYSKLRQALDSFCSAQLLQFDHRPRRVNLSCF